MAKQRGGSKKLRRSKKKEGYYNNFAARYSGKLIRRRGNREKRIEAANEHPEIGSPSQIRTRKKLGFDHWGPLKWSRLETATRKEISV